MMNNEEFDSKIFYCWTYGDIRCAIQDMNDEDEGVPETNEFISKVGDYLEAISDANEGVCWSIIQEGIRHTNNE